MATAIYCILNIHEFAASVFHYNYVYFIYVFENKMYYMCIFKVIC